MQKDYYSQKNTFNPENKAGEFDFSSNIDTSKILKGITKILKPLLQKVLINIAKRDLRKRRKHFS